MNGIQTQQVIDLLMICASVIGAITVIVTSVRKVFSKCVTPLIDQFKAVEKLLKGQAESSEQIKVLADNLSHMTNDVGQITQQLSEGLKKQEAINDLQNQAIDESKTDRKRLHADIDGIRVGHLAQVKIELDKITGRALARGGIDSRELERMIDLYAGYKALGGNHGMNKRVERCQQLPTMKTQMEEERI